MEEKNIKRLQEEQERAVEDTDDQLTTWEKFKSDYTALQDRLRTLPDKISHPVMVPFGSKAFMPGRLVHTNEILVLLGDNWFVNRSAKQACEIIDRRMEGINKHIADLEKQKKLLQPRIDFTSELHDIAQAQGDLVEIQEEFDPVKEKQWKEQHRKNVQEHRKRVVTDQGKVMTKKPVSQPEETTKTDAHLWARLDELERIEASQNELSRLTPGNVEAEEAPSHVSEKSVRWADQEGDSDDSEDSDGETTVARPKSICFSHTKIQDEDTDSVGSTPPAKTSSDITSPADIYKVFVSGQPTVRSILKPCVSTTTTTHTTDSVMIGADIEKNVTPTRQKQAFSGSIVERDTTKSEGSESTLTLGDVKQKPQKRVSKFKKDRQKQQTDNTGR